MMPKALIPAALLAAAVALPFGGAAHRRTEEGNRRYLEGDYEQALRAYTEAQVAAPAAPELVYDIGNVLYRQGDYEGAAEAYTQALLTAGERLEPRVAFNLGNARFMQQDYGEALKAYRRALEIDPGDHEAKRNLELTLRALEQQQQPQQQPQQEQQSQQDQEKGTGGEEGEPPEEEQRQERGADREEQPDDPPSGEDRQGAEAEPSPERMSPEEAARLLDGLSEEERKNLRQELLRRLAAAGRAREKDW